MKKSVIILIAVIYVAAIAVVSFFGLKPDSRVEKVYVDSVKITNTEGIQYKENGDKYVVIRPDENGELKYKIEYEVGPDNATDKTVSFTYDTSVTYVSVDEETGVVTFDMNAMTRNSGAIIITITSTDGLKVSDSIEIKARKQ